jgi:hypothetical protein
MAKKYPEYIGFPCFESVKNWTLFLSRTSLGKEKSFNQTLFTMPVFFCLLPAWPGSHVFRPGWTFFLKIRAFWFFSGCLAEMFFS